MVTETKADIRAEYEHYKFEDGSCLTRCTIWCNRRPTAVGYAVCSSRDNFNRDKGRTIARGRAIKAMAERKNISPRKRSDNLALRELARLGLHAKAYYKN
jgi:hypothetical protein